MVAAYVYDSDHAVLIHNSHSGGDSVGSSFIYGEVISRAACAVVYHGSCNVVESRWKSGVSHTVVNQRFEMVDFICEVKHLVFKRSVARLQRLIDFPEVEISCDFRCGFIDRAGYRIG